MPAVQRFKTAYVGVFYINSTHSVSGKPEKVYYIRYRRDGKMVEEPVGRQYRDDMTPAKANNIRSGRIDGKTLSNRKRREDESARKKAEEGRWTIDKLWNEYRAQRPPGKSLKVDSNRYENYLKDVFGKKVPEEIIALDVDRLRIRLLKKKSPQTVVHILNLLTWVVNFGVKKGLSKPLPFKVQKPGLDNKKTEDLTQDELERLLSAIDADENQDVANMMRVALYSGMRRGEIFNLQWKDIDFERGFITIRDPKGGESQKIPLNDVAESVLKSQVKAKSKYVFPGQGGKKRVTAAKASKRIKAEAGLPEDFRPFHGLRHVYASALASSGKVDMYTLQKLLTHKTPTMTQRYAHLRDEALKKASDVASDIFNNVAG